LQAYQQILEEIRELGAQLVAVSPQNPENSVSSKERMELEFEVLSDVGNKVARQYGLVFRLPEPLQALYQKFGVNLAEYNGDSSYELPVPGTYVIARDGTIKLAFVNADYTQRLEPTDILACLRDIAGSEADKS
jgi:peroxiredoxin